MITESKFALVPQEYIDHIAEEINRIISSYKTGNITNDIAVFRKDHRGRKLLITTIRIADKKIKIYLKLGLNVTGLYTESRNEIVFSVDQLLMISNANTIGTIAHEIRHIIQEYQKTSKNYDIAVELMQKGKEYNPYHYYLEPSEFEAQLVGMAHNISADINKQIKFYRMQTPERWRGNVQRKIAEYIRVLQAPWADYEKSVHKYPKHVLPTAMAEHYRFLKYAASDKRLWQKLKLKLYNLLQEIRQRIVTK